MSAQSKVKLQQQWRTYEYLIIDEMSMLGKTFLACLSHNVAIGKMAEGSPASSESFGGISVIMCRDFHQFPPVAVAASEVLYIPGNPRKDSTLSQVGHAIYEEFQMVVLLQQQMQVSNKVWWDFLHHLCMGHIQCHHLDMLCTLILTSLGTTHPDFITMPWVLACLMTPQHAVHQQWNHATLEKHAGMMDTIIFECVAEDTMGNQTHQSRHEYQGRRRNHELLDTIELCLGSSVMVTENVETDLDITNGAHGTIVDIFLHPDEPPTTCCNGVIQLRLLPSFLLVKLDRT
ncbi:hypothetical protein EDD16DRAFT_1425629, partial [Pisolithus croceorrhizus]